MRIRLNYTAPLFWEEQATLEDILLTVSSTGEDLVGEEIDPWSVGGEY